MRKVFKTKPETTIEATVKVTLIFDDQIDKEEAAEIVKCNLGCFDNAEISSLKVFQKEVKA